MRIAVSGTHCSGKTTLIDAFLTAHPDFANEPEPYALLVEDYGEEFSAEPGIEDFLRQLQFSVAQLNSHKRSEAVIFERCPVDFLAYLLALKDIHRELVDSPTIDAATELVKESLPGLDLIVFVPLDDANVIEVEAEEDPRLRRAVNRRLMSIFGADELGLDSALPEVIEVIGSTEQRLRMLEEKLRQSVELRG